MDSAATDGVAAQNACVLLGLPPMPHSPLSREKWQTADLPSGRSATSSGPWRGKGQRSQRISTEGSSSRTKLAIVKKSGEIPSGGVDVSRGGRSRIASTTE